MKKRTARKSAAKKSPRSASKKAPAATTGLAPSNADGKLAFNHAMIYVKDVEKALGFYAALLGFKVIEDFRYEGKSVYARLRAPGNDGTLALHQAGPNDSIASNGVRLYFEVAELDDFCRKLQQKNFYITKMPQMMPWGWRHAYLNDPDGHEISLYWAGANRMKKSVMSTAKKAGAR